MVKIKIMRKGCLLFIILIAFGCAKPENHSAGTRRIIDPNASINRTDIPRTLNANNATNSTPADWVDAKTTTATNNTSAAEDTGKSRENAGAGNPSEASATDNLSTKGTDNKRTQTKQR
jgi:hypothetical protein